MQHRTIRGLPFSFEGHWYLYKIYQDKHPDIVVRKSAQCGVSEWLLSTAIWLGDRNFNTIYVMPTDSVLSDFIHARVDPAIGDSPYLRNLVFGTDNVGLKQIRRAFVYFRAYLQANPKQHKLKTVDADCMIYDEYDELGQNVRALGEKRLGHSALGWQRAVSTPTYPDAGIDREYQESDQCEWMIKCEACGERQSLDFFKNVQYRMEGEDVAWVQTVCAKCQKPIDRMKEGEWVAKYPSRAKRGYHINKLFCAMTDLRRVVKNSQKTLDYEIKEFFNSDLGLPYAPKGGKLTKSDLIACKGSWPNQRIQTANCWMGIDVGKRHNVMIGKGQNVLFMTEIDDLKAEGGALMELFDVDVCVIDANPELHLVRSFQEAFLGRVFLAYYWGQDDKRREVFKVEEEDPEKGTVDSVHINRTAMGDYLVQGQVKVRQLRFPRDIENIQNFMDQMVAPTRVIERDANGNFVAKWLEYGKPDHYFHAGIYGLVARYIQEGNTIMLYGGAMTAPNRDTGPGKDYDSEAIPGRQRGSEHAAEEQRGNDNVRSIDRSDQPDW